MSWIPSGNLSGNKISVIVKNAKQADAYVGCFVDLMIKKTLENKMKKIGTIILGMVFSLLAVSLLSAQDTGKQNSKKSSDANVVKNGTFELVKDGKFPDWYNEVHVKEGAQGKIEIADNNSREGKKCVRIIHESDFGWIRISQSKVPAQKNQNYEFECAVKPNGKYSIICYELDNDKAVAHHVIASGEGNGDVWKKIKNGFKTSENANSFKISLVSETKGDVMFDDVSLLPLTESAKAETKLNYSNEKVNLDGKLDDKFWSSIAYERPLLLLGGNKTASPETRFKIGTDGISLFIGFFCEEPNINGIVAKAEKDGLDVYNDDCVEIFLNCNQDKVGYMHLIVTPKGFKGGEIIPGNQLFRDWFDQGGSSIPFNSDGWKAVSRTGEKCWTAEIQIPLALLSSKIRSGEKWQVNFCRERRAAGNPLYSTWSYIPGSSFLAPDFFGTLILPKELSAEKKTADSAVSSNTGKESVARENVIIPLKNDLTALAQCSFELWPKPKKMVIGKDSVALPENVIIPQKNDLTAISQDLPSAVELFKKVCVNRFGIKCDESKPAAKKFLNLCLDADWAISPPVKAEMVDAGFPTIAQQAYWLKIDKDGVTIKANHSSGLRYGLCSLINIISQMDTPSLPFLEISDWPDFQVRGFNIMAPYNQKFYPALIEISSLMKYNRLWLRMDNRLQYPSCPGLGDPTAMKLEKMKEMVQFARGFGFDVCPEISLYSHDNWITKSKGYEDLKDGEDGSNINPRSPKTRKVLTDVVDTLVELFDKPKAFNITHDELCAGAVGVAPETKGIPPAELIAESLNHWNRYIKSKGVGAVYAYGDALKESGIPGATGGLPHHTYLARKKIDKDIVIAEWLYLGDEKYPALDLFIGEGFKVVPATWYRPLNIRNYFREAKKQKSIIEVMGTTWQQDPWIFAEPELMQGIIVNGAYAWNTAPELSEWHIMPDDYFKILYKRENKVQPVAKSTPLEMDKLFNISWTDADFLDGKEISNLPDGKFLWKNIPFVKGRGLLELSRKDGPVSLPKSIEGIAVNSMARKIFFLQTTSLKKLKVNTVEHRYKNHELIGEYTVKYKDGSTSKIPIKYREQVADWNDYGGCVNSWLAFKTKTKDQFLFQLYALEWDNPSPGKEIESIGIKSADGSVSLTVAAITLAQ